MNKLKDIDSDNKENIIYAIGEKQNLLNDILKKYKEIKDDYLIYDDYYRKRVFAFYRKEYCDIALELFSSTQNKNYISIGVDIQILLRNKFFDFFSKYYNLINKIIDIEKFRIKSKNSFSNIIKLKLWIKFIN